MDIGKLTVEDLFLYLSLELDEDIAKVMKDQSISGQNFLDLTNEDVREILPLVGQRMRVMQLKSNLMTPKNVEIPDDSHVRKLLIVVFLNTHSLRMYAHALCRFHVRFAV